MRRDDRGPHTVPVVFKPVLDLAGGSCGLQRCPSHTTEEVLQPKLPVILLANLLKEIVVVQALCLENRG